jgi:PIN domain nuclease of toxin-antitoxin system
VIAYLDTSVAVWLAQGKTSSLSKEAKAVSRRAELLVSPIVLLEFEVLYEIRRTVLRSQDLLLKLQRELGVRVCELGFASISTIAIAEKWTRDPFDRLIVANAKANGFAALISADERIAMHYPRTIW